MLEVDNPFWQFSTRVYAAPGVAPECIGLQDRHGVDVNILLFAAWLGADRCTALAANDIERTAKAVEGWSDNVVKPLRETRRKLKLRPEIALPQVHDLRGRIAEVELLSEQLEQAFLYALAADVGHPVPGGRQDVVEGNVAAVLSWYRIDDRAVYPKHLYAACSAGQA
jgi:uncharacterized protein (TIGR02444 family)